MEQPPIGDSDATLKQNESGPTVRPGADLAPPSGPVARRIGRYDVLRELGKGGMGVVYLAWQTDLRRHVALKVIRGVESHDDVERFKREAQIVAQLSHPNIIPVYEIGEHESRPFMAMSYIEGQTLDRILKEPNRPPLRTLVEWLRDAARATDHAHQKGVVHRDLKPQNLIVDGALRLFVMDFGLARQREPGSSMTMSGIVMGTPSYMAPEQARGRAHLVGPASDVYSLGATLYEILTSRPPFAGNDPVALLKEVAESEPKTPRSLNPRVHADLETMCLKAMDKTIARRYATAAAFADDLQRWLDGEPIEARPVSGIGRLVRAARRHKVLSAAIALVSVLLLAGTGLYAALEARSARRLARSESVRREVELVGRRLYESDFAPDRERRDELVEQAARHAERALAIDPRSAAAHAARGRVLTVRGSVDEALAAFARADTLDPRYAPTHLFRAQALMETYEQRIPAVVLHSNGAPPTVSRRVPERPRQSELRARIEAELEAFAREFDGTSDEDRYEIVAARGQLALIRGESKEAYEYLSRARKMRPIDPVLDEPFVLACMHLGAMDEALRAAKEGAAVSCRFRARLLGYAAILRFGRAPVSEREYAEIVEGLDAAIAEDRRLETLREARALVSMLRGLLRARQGGDGAAHFEASRRDLEAFRLGGGDARAALHHAAVLRYYEALADEARGKPAVPAFQEARRLFDEARAADPENPRVALDRHQMLSRWAEHACWTADADAREAEVIEDAADLDGRFPADPFVRVGTVESRAEVADRRLRRGGDGAGLLRAAIGKASEVVAAWPEHPGGWSARGWARTQLAQSVSLGRGDAGALVAEAREDLDRAATLAPTNEVIATRRGNLEVVHGLWLLSARRDGEADVALAKAESAFTTAVDLSPESSRALAALAEAKFLRVVVDVQGRKLVEERFAAALEACDRLIRLAPQEPKGWDTRGQLRGLRMTLAVWTGGTADATQAVADLRRALELAPDNAAFAGHLGRVLFEQAMLAQRDGGDAGPAVRAALPYLERGATIGRRNVDILQLLGGARLAVGDADGAVRAWEAALAADPSREAQLRPLIESARGGKKDE